MTSASPSECIDCAWTILNVSSQLLARIVETPSLSPLAPQHLARGGKTPTPWVVFPPSRKPQVTPAPSTQGTAIPIVRKASYQPT